MGAQLVAQVLQYWKSVNDTSFRILVRMALTALDQEKDGKPARLYFGGHELLAMSLRRPFPEGDSPEARKARQNVLRDVRRALKELIKMGAVEVVDTGHAVRAGHSKTYRLTLGPSTGGGGDAPSSGGAENPSSLDSPGGAENPSPGGGVTPSPGGGVTPSSGGVESPPEQGAKTPPRSTEEPSQDSYEEDQGGSGPQAEDPRPRSETDAAPPSLGLGDRPLSTTVTVDLQHHAHRGATGTSGLADLPPAAVPQARATRPPVPRQTARGQHPFADDGYGDCARCSLPRQNKIHREAR